MNLQVNLNFIDLTHKHKHIVARIKVIGVVHTHYSTSYYIPEKVGFLCFTEVTDADMG